LLAFTASATIIAVAKAPEQPDLGSTDRNHRHKDQRNRQKRH
jgi:hypothetical protein